MRSHLIDSRPHIQGSRAPVRLRHSSGELTDGGGLVLVRRLWDQLGLGRWLDSQSRWMTGRFRPSLIIEQWVVLLLYGGGVLDDLKLLRARGVCRLFGWTAIADPTTFGRWLRRAGDRMAGILDQLVWRLVQQRWAVVGVPPQIMVILDSTVVVRYGTQQAGAERGYNPTKRGRPSHHPLVAFASTGDCLGVRWRPGKAHTAAGAIAWLRTLVERLRDAGVADITVRLDKGFFSQDMVEALTDLQVRFFLKVPQHQWVLRRVGPWRHSDKDDRLWTATGSLYGARLLGCEWRLPRHPTEQELPLESYEIDRDAYVLTNDPSVHVLTAWRIYNSGALVEQRIAELGQLAVGRTAVDDLGGNALLWALGAVSYQILHGLRTLTLRGTWRTAQPQRLRVWLLRLPGKLTQHARKHYLQLLRTEPLRRHLLVACRTVSGLPPLPEPATG